jgi:hypothetical protein
MKIIKNIISIGVAFFVLVSVFSFGQYIGINRLGAESEVVVESNDDSFDLELPGEVEKSIVTVEEVKAKLSEIGELSTYEGEYAVRKGKDYSRYIDIGEDFKIPFTTNSVEFSCKGIVKVGYDISDINIKVAEDIIYISLPTPKITDNYIIWDSVECVEDNNIFNPIDFSQYQEVIDEIENEGLNNVTNEGIYENAEENIEKIIKNFLTEFSDYDIEFI